MKTLTRLYPGVRQQSWHRGCYLPLSYSPVEPRVSSMFSDLRQVFCFYFTQQMSIYYLIFYRNVRVLLVKQDSLITFNMKVKVKSAVCSDTVMKAWGQFLPTKIYTSAWKRSVGHNKVFFVKVHEWTCVEGRKWDEQVVESAESSASRLRLREFTQGEEVSVV